MCGLAGSINIKFNLENLSLLNHRGPDSFGIKQITIFNQNIIFGHTRLSIVDLSENGHQPMTDASGNYSLIFNGEIYNHLELRDSLKGIHFKSHSDTETLLYYLIKYGVDGISKLNGIFSFAFLDHVNGEMLLVRDPYGVKPLYYQLNENELVFSSEIKFIKNLKNDQKLNYQSLYQYLRIRFCPSPLSLSHGILKLEPGTYLKINLKENVKITSKVYFSKTVKNNYTIQIDDALEKYEYYLRNAIRSQLMSDVPVSIMLSGGIDSALLAFLIKDLSDSGLNTFTAGYSSDNNLNNNEILYARETSNWLNSNHHEVLIKEKSFFQMSKKLIEIVEEPVSSQSLLPFYFLTEAIHEKGYKVSFSGQGVDEAFAGYNRYRFQNLYDLSPNRLFKSLFFFKPYLRNDNLRRGLNSLMEPNRSKRYIESNSYFEKDKIGEIVNNTNQFPKDSENVFLTLLNETADKFNSQDLDGINYQLRMDTLFTLPDDLLLYTDKIAMHHSIEVRVPFLDLELMNFLESLPTKYKSNLFSSKILHRKLSEKYLPKEIINRKKNGFYIPRSEWFKSSDMNELKQEILTDQTIFSKIFNKTYLLGIINDHQIGKYNYENQIFSLMNLFYWFKLNNNEY